MYQHLLGIANARIKLTILKALLRMCSIVLVLAMFSFSTLYAQDYNFPQETNYGIRLGADYELPGKNLKDSYRANVNYNAGFMRTFNRYSIEAVVSYRRFGAYHGVRYDTSDPANTVTTIISPYTTYLFYISAAYNLLEGDKVNVYAGLNLGTCLSKSAISYFDNTHSLYLPNTDKQGYIAPKLGLNYALSDSWYIDARASYNLFTASGSYTFNTRTGSTGQTLSLSTSVSAGVGVLFKY